MKAKQSEMEKKALRKRIYQYRVQYLFLVPAFVAVIIFAYIPMAGVVMSANGISRKTQGYGAF